MSGRHRRGSPRRARPGLSRGKRSAEREDGAESRSHPLRPGVDPTYPEGAEGEGADPEPTRCTS